MDGILLYSLLSFSVSSFGTCSNSVIVACFFSFFPLFLVCFTSSYLFSLTSTSIFSILTLFLLASSYACELVRIGGCWWKSMMEGLSSNDMSSWTVLSEPLYAALTSSLSITNTCELGIDASLSYSGFSYLEPEEAGLLSI